MNKSQMDARYQRRIHHHAILHKQDGTTTEGYMQPWDEEYVYLTQLDGASAGRVALSEITRIDFPED